MTGESVGVVAGRSAVVARRQRGLINNVAEKLPELRKLGARVEAQLPTQLSTAVQGGNPPDIAVLPQPGLMKDFAGKGALNPRVLECPGWNEHYGQEGGVHTHVRQPEDFRGKREAEGSGSGGGDAGGFVSGCRRG